LHERATIDPHDTDQPQRAATAVELRACRCDRSPLSDVRSTNVRRSTRREREREVGDHKFHSPYRCRACNERFWVVSRKARTAAIVATVCSVGLALLIAFLIVSVRDDDAAASDATTAAREDEPAPPPAAPELKDPLRATDLPRPAPPVPRSPPAKSEAQPLRPPAQPFVK
jgi:hypothetical protein